MPTLTTANAKGSTLVSNWSFDASDVPALGRLRLHFARPTPVADRLMLNDGLLAYVPAGTSEMVIPNPGVREGTNDVTWRASGAGNSAVTSIDFADALRGQHTGVSVRTDGTVVHGVWVPRSDYRRGTAWLVVTLHERQRPTTLSINGGRTIVVQDGALIQEQPNGAAGRFHVPIGWSEVQAGANSLVAGTSGCLRDVCPTPGNVDDVYVMWDYDDNPAHPRLAPEVCGNQQDDDLNGFTDERSDVHCDGPDLDGCALGTQSCSASPSCSEYRSVPHQTERLTELTLPVTSMDLVTQDASIHVTQSMQFPVLGAMRRGIDLGDIGSMLPPGTGAPQRLRSIIFHLSADPIGTIGGPGTNAPLLNIPIAVRAAAGDDGRTFTINLNEDAPLDNGHPVLLLWGPGNPAPLGSFYGCPDGAYTTSPRIEAVNLCSLGSVDCTTNHVGGSWCDTAPSTPDCFECSGDWDGCGDGVMVDVPGVGNTCFADTNPLHSERQIPTSATMYVTAVAWQFSSGTVTQTMTGAVPVDLRGLIADGGLDVPGLVVPNIAGGGELQHVDLSGMAYASVSTESPTPLAVRSGPQDPGNRLRLIMRASMTGGRDLRPGDHLQVALSPDFPWDARSMFTCSEGSHTFPSVIAVQPNVPAIAPGTDWAGNPLMTNCYVMSTMSAFAVAATQVEFCYDAGPCLTYTLPPGSLIDLHSALEGGDAFGGGTVPYPEEGHGATELISMRIQGTFTGAVFNYDANHPVMVVTNAQNPLSSGTTTLADGLKLEFEMNASPHPGEPLRLIRSVYAAHDGHVNLCPDGTVQLDHELNVRAYTPPPP